jgi:hypothetical protein
MNAANSRTKLTAWQQKQAAMLSYFSSVDYLMELHKMVSCLINGTVEPVLDQARLQKRDAVLVDPRWGSRSTSQNWSNYGWPYLKELQLSLAEDIAARASGMYSRTSVSEHLRGVEQFSLDWMTPGEECLFTEATQRISEWAAPIDLTMSDARSSGWNDYDFAYSYPQFATRFTEIPRYRIRTDVIHSSGAIPGKTGIYISKDDPNATLQFAWTGAEGRKLRDAATFNEVGLAALAAVGRDDLWFNSGKMFDFTTSPQFERMFHDDVIWNDGPHPNLAPSAVARKAFTTKASTWYLVEPIEGEFDRLDDLGSVEQTKQGPRIVGGEMCAEAGFYFSPSRTDSRRYLSKGEYAPIFDSQYGTTLWQWDPNQA